jgi:hypothetical protein
MPETLALSIIPALLSFHAEAAPPGGRDDHRVLDRMTWRHLKTRLDKIAKSPLRNQMEQRRARYIKAAKTKKETHKEQEKLLNRELEDSFPASDPPSLTQPTTEMGGPDRKRHKAK